MTTPHAQFASALDLPLLHAGKVRELYDLGDRLLMVATDNISAFDHVLTSQIEHKGAVLTQLSLWWFDQLGVEHHVLSAEVPSAVSGRAVVCEKLEMLPVECVVRGYLTGSGWVEYQESQSVCGVPLPAGLTDGARLPEPIFTPATKAAVGEHDENVTFDEIVATIGRADAEAVREKTLAVYATAERIARERGIILADTKLEFGKRPDGTIVLADEVLTPDSSRFWDAQAWQQGKLESFDKQYLRNWLLHESGWDKASDTPPPPLPAEVIAATGDRYREAYERLTGQAFATDGMVPQATATPDRIAAMTRVVVDVMPKPEILDPQGKAVTQALGRMGYEGLTVRQGKRFEVEVDGEVTPDRLEQIRTAAETLLANTVIEGFDVRVESGETSRAEVQ
ncbi:phosphoribosylaminoimidazolesuccinocarboxamide synthase [Propionibacteriaceae bacterium Y1700]|uniref:phosphoribosylaminoimidazolesuccinocarboxamide synthase n=1 Tax=Microlunatus sp. Y1700 TaxID=3418487 RepID=UPI003DA76487